MKVTAGNETCRGKFLFKNTRDKQTLKAIKFTLSLIILELFRCRLHINLGHTVRRQQIISGQNDRLLKITFTKDNPDLTSFHDIV